MRRSIGFIALLLLAVAGLFLRGNTHRPDALPLPPIAQTPAPGTSAPPPSTPAPAPAPAPQEGSNPAQPAAKPASLPRGSVSDYILALSWSPAFCASEDPSGATDQCRIGSRNGLMVHGLWPQSSTGGDAFCDSTEPDRLPGDLARQVKTFMPSVGLARHEWQKHGACTGLSQRDYFATMERAWRQFRVPALLAGLGRQQTVSVADLSAAIATTNPALPRNAVSLICGRGGTLSEIRICLDGGLGARPCPRPAGRACTGTVTLLPPR